MDSTSDRIQRAPNATEYAVAVPRVLKMQSQSSAAAARSASRLFIESSIRLAHPKPMNAL